MRAATPMLIWMLFFAAAGPVCFGGEATPIVDKTLVVWTAPADLTQRAGGALTLENPGGVFDSIVFGELQPARWMAGSDVFSRTKKAQQDWPAETADPQTLVQIAIVYRGKQVTILRNGQIYAEYTMGPQPVTFSTGSVVLMGLRHLDAGHPRYYAGSIDDARIYNVALDGAVIASLEPNQPSDPQPLAWWDFETDKVEDKMKTFAEGKLFGGAKIADGRLHLDGRDDVALIGKAGLGRLLATTGATDLGQAINNARAFRQHLLQDPHRPGYHFVAPEGRCAPFDPNGALFFKGRYHLMYIYQGPTGHAWGHASSTDLVHWRHHGPSLEPGEGDEGIFSGGVFVDRQGVPTITYWGLGKPRGICIATSTDDDLEHWAKSPHNPVIQETHWGYTVQNEGRPNQVVYGAADPSAIWSHNGRYYMLTGNLLVLNEFGKKRKQAEHLGDTLYLLVSDDLAKWEYLHPFYQSDRKWTRADEDNMCPDFFPLPTGPDGGPASDRHMILFISHNLGCQYYVGRYADDRFTPETHGRMTWADNAYFAPESLLDDQGRRIMWAWVHDQRSGAARAKSGWSGTMSLPRVLWLGEDGTLRMRPAKELQLLRYNARTLTDLAVKADSELDLETVSGSSIELAVEMVPDGAQQFGVKVCCSPDGDEQTLVYYDAADKKLKIDTGRSSLGDGPKRIEAGPFELKAGEPLRLRVFVDKSIVEAYANDRQAVVRRIYPSRKDSLDVALFSNGGPVRVTTVEAWDMMPPSPY